MVDFVTVFQRERIDVIFDEVAALAEGAHHLEISYPGEHPLKLDRDAYAHGEASGAYRFFTARQQDTGRLVGYAGFWVLPTAHHVGVIQACQDGVYVDPDFRCGELGSDLLKYADENLRAEGVDVVLHFVRHFRRDFGPILRRLGYQPIEQVWAKHLKD